MEARRLLRADVVTDRQIVFPGVLLASSGKIDRLKRWGMRVLLLGAVVTVTAAQPSKQSATEFDLAYRAAFAKAKAIEDLTPYMSKEMKAQVDSTPAADRPEMFEFVKEMSASMTNVKVSKETKTDEGVTLTVEAMDGTDKMTGQVRILQENGAWKMGRESWSNKP